MTWLWRAMAIGLLALAGFFAGGSIGAATVPADAGLAAGATVFLWAAGGTVVAVGCGAVLLARAPRRTRAVRDTAGATSRER